MSRQMLLATGLCLATRQRCAWEWWGVDQLAEPFTCLQGGVVYTRCACTRTPGQRRRERLRLCVVALRNLLHFSAFTN